MIKTSLLLLSLSSLVLFVVFIFLLCYFCCRVQKKKNIYKYKKYQEEEEIKDPFIISFRKTRTESLIIAKVDEISKSRDIQFVVSCHYYNNERSIKGCVYVITSKILYKLFFVKQNLIVKEIHTFKSFVSNLNKKGLYKTLLNYFNDFKNNYVKQEHHNEFFTWSHYYAIKDYDTTNLENFLKNL